MSLIGEVIRDSVGAAEPEAAPAQEPKPESRITVSQVLTLYVSLGEAIKRQQENYDLLLLSTPAKIRCHLQTVRETAQAVIDMVVRLERGNQ